MPEKKSKDTKGRNKPTDIKPLALRTEKTQTTPDSQAKDPADKKEVDEKMKKSADRANRLDRRSHYTLFGDELAPLDLATARLVQKARKMDDYFETGGILKNNKHDYLLLEKLGPTEFKVSETKTDKIYFLKVEASKMPSQGPKLARHVHIMLRSRNTNPLFRRHLLKMTDRGIIEGSYNFILTRFAGPSLEDLRRKGPQGQQFTPSTALRLCVQTFQAIHDIHLCHFVHRDIQPKNFLIGMGSRANIVYMIGFGLAEQYFPKKKRKYPWEGRLTKFPWLNLTFQSRSFHRGDRIYRQHDLESWLYMCYYLFNSNILPWRYWNQPTTSERQIYNLKRLFFIGAYDSQLLKYSPQELVGLRNMVAKEQSPNPIEYSPYAELLLVLKEMLYKTPVNWNAPFELEPPKHLKVAPAAPANLKKPVAPTPFQKTPVAQKFVAKSTTKPAMSVPNAGGQSKMNQQIQEVVSCEECKRPFSLGHNNFFYTLSPVDKDVWVEEITASSGCRMGSEESSSESHKELRSRESPASFDSRHDVETFKEKPVQEVLPPKSAKRINDVPRSRNN